MIFLFQLPCIFSDLSSKATVVSLLPLLFSLHPLSARKERLTCDQCRITVMKDKRLIQMENVWLLYSSHTLQLLLLTYCRLQIHLVSPSVLRNEYYTVKSVIICIAAQRDSSRPAGTGVFLRGADSSCRLTVCLHGNKRFEAFFAVSCSLFYVFVCGGFVVLGPSLRVLS